MKILNLKYLSFFILFFCARAYSLENDLKKAQELFELGVAYQYGEGAPKDEKKAVDIYKEAADKGSPEALFNLSAMYFHGQGGLRKDKKKSLELLQQAADKGLAEAQFRLSGMYYLGKAGLPEDKGKSAELLKKAADQGLPKAKELQGIADEDKMSREKKALQTVREDIALNEALDDMLKENNANQRNDLVKPSAGEVKKVIKETPELANAIKAKIKAKAILQEADRLEKVEESRIQGG